MNRLTDEEIEAISKTFDAKYAGKGLSPSEVMELHKSEYWDTVFQAERSRLAAMAPEEALLTEEELGKAVGAVKWDLKYEPLIIQDKSRTIAKAQLAKVWPIYQAKLEAERERTLKEVGDWLYKQNIAGCLPPKRSRLKPSSPA